MRRFLCASIAASALGVSAWASSLYLATDLGENVFAYDINNSGDVVGGVCLPDGDCRTGITNSRAFLYHNGSLNIIAPNPSVATGINNSGQVVGYDPTAVFLYSRGDLTVLPLPSANFPLSDAEQGPIRINSSGDIAANVDPAYCSSPPGAFPQSVIYRNGIATCLNVGPGFTTAKGINDAGVAVGVVFDFWPFIYSGGLLMLIPEFSFGSANAINNSGQVVGQGFVFGHPAGAFLYSNGVVTYLSALGVFTSSSANAINSAGDVVGYGDGFAFLYADGAFARTYERSAVDGRAHSVIRSLLSRQVDVMRQRILDRPLPYARRSSARPPRSLMLPIPSDAAHRSELMAITFQTQADHHSKVMPIIVPHRCRSLSRSGRKIR